ncbi:hypothetical protein [Azospirillum sp. SYSU D00513]|uniref:hypothetical protein n=1 Tax=Azospirillum sp. SYSU D00513 TaxID=2812561 RepID=UPI001A96F4DA|nr:hypothetical protein [Azospirillum sp. SYSU D00513]
MSQALKLDPSLLQFPAVSLTAEERQAVLDRLHLQRAEPWIEDLAIRAEERRRQQAESQRNLRTAFDLFRRAAAGDDGDLASVTASIVSRQRAFEKELRPEFNGIAAALAKARKLAEQRSAEFRAAIIPLIDRGLELDANRVRYFRDSAIQFQALGCEQDGHRIAETLYDDELRVQAVAGLFDDASAARRRRLVASLCLLGKEPANSRLQLTPVGVTSSIWIMLADAPTAVILKRKREAEQDALIAVTLAEFKPVLGDGLAILSGGAGWSFRNGRLEIGLGQGEDVDWSRAFSERPAAEELITGEFGEEAVEW